jgi:Mg2+/Co2+ transporter CorB
MDDIPLAVLFGALAGLLVISAFFSASETAMMSLNRYRLRHLAKARHPGALRASALLDRPDRLIGLILLGNNFANILASAIATIIGLRLYGEAGIAIATGVLTLVLLVFAEVTPKTLAALHPQPIAFASAYFYVPALKVTYPLVWGFTVIANAFVRLLGLRTPAGALQQLSHDELRTVVKEAGAIIPRRHQQMLLGILDLESVTVEHVMVPSSDIVGIDLEEDWASILNLLMTTQYTRLPVYHGSIDKVVGVLHVRNILRQLAAGGLDKETLIKTAREVYYVPEGTPLNAQILNFQRDRRRIGLVVDEYGEIKGLVTLEDILEEIIGEFTTDAANASPDIVPQEDGSYLVAGGAGIREVNRTLHWDLPVTGPKTINGMILEHLESIPEPGTSVLIAGYPIEILQTGENTVRLVRIRPRLTESNDG